MIERVVNQWTRLEGEMVKPECMRLHTKLSMPGLQNWSLLLTKQWLSLVLTPGHTLPSHHDVYHAISDIRPSHFFVKC